MPGSKDGAATFRPSGCTSSETKDFWKHLSRITVQKYDNTKRVPVCFSSFLPYSDYQCFLGSYCFAQTGLKIKVLLSLLPRLQWRIPHGIQRFTDILKSLETPDLSLFPQDNNLQCVQIKNSHAPSTIKVFSRERYTYRFLPTRQFCKRSLQLFCWKVDRKCNSWSASFHRRCIL